MKITVKPSSLIFPKLKGFDYFVLNLAENSLIGFYDDGFPDGNFFMAFAISKNVKTRSEWIFNKRFGVALTDDFGMTCFKAQLNKATVEAIKQFLNENKTLENPA